MKCPNCNNEVEDESLFCRFCGASLKNEEKSNELENKDENVNEDENANEDVNENENEKEIENEQIVQDEPIEEKEPEETTVDNSIQDKEEEKEEYVEEDEDGVQRKVTVTYVDNKSSNKRGRHSLITIGILLLVIVLMFAICFGIYSFLFTPERIYKHAIKNSITSAFNSQAITSNTINANTDIEVNTNISQLAPLLSDLKLHTNLKYDNTKQEYYINANIDKGEDSYLKLQLLAQVLDKKLYISESNLYDKPVAIELADEYIPTEESSLVSKESINKVASIVADTINKNLTKDNFSSSSKTKTINGKKQKVKDYTFTISSNTIYKLMHNVVEQLKSNEEFLNCFKDRQKIIEDLDNLYNVLISYELEENYEIHCYTSGVLNSFVGFDIYFYDENTKYVLEVTKKSKNKYDLNFGVEYYEAKITALTGGVTVNTLQDDVLDIDVNFNILEMGDINIKLSTMAEYNTNISNDFNIKNSVNVQDLTVEDIEEITDNLYRMPLYSLFSSFLANAQSPDETITEEPELPNGIELEEDQSFVMSYDDDIVKFRVPSTLENSYSSDTFRSYTKGNSTKKAHAVVSCEWDTIDEYIEEINNSLDYYKDQEGYKNIESSDVEKVEVNGKTFNKKTTKVSYSSGTYSYNKITTYYFIEINEEYLYAVEIDDEYNLLTDDEIKKLLTFEVVK